MSRIHIGTSGWNYEHWQGSFFPEDLSKKEWLKYYQDHFDTVEINNTFYNLPEASTLEDWRNQVSKNFIFSVKANRYITHMKKLNEPEESLKKMLNVFKSLGKKLGPVLFQLPPNWNFDEQRLREFLEIIPEEIKTVFEFRDKSWINETTFSILQEKNIAFCIYDLAGYQSPIEMTADFMYVRLHGPSDQKYKGKYGRETLSTWVDRMNAWKEKGLETYIYFDNDEQGFAPQNALELKEILE